MAFVGALADIEGKVPGTCMLHTKSSISRHAVDFNGAANAQTQAVAMLQQAAKHKQWRSKAQLLLEKIMKAKGVLDSFIEKQKESGDACSARLMEAKRAYDGLLKDVKLLAAQIDAHESAMEAEKEDLSATLESIEQVEDEHKEELDKCAKKKKEALDAKAGFEAELKELQQIAKPAARYEDTQAADTVAAAKAATAKSLEKYGGFKAATGLIQEGAWTQQACKKFVKYMNHRGRTLDPRDCDKAREKLQKAFEEAYIGVQKLIKQSAKESTEGYKVCVEEANVKKTIAMTPLTEQQEESNTRIQASTRALSSLMPTVELIRKRAEAMQEYIDETLTPECYEDGEVSEHLQKVRELIMELAECPGRDDFQLKIPAKAKAEEENAGNNNNNNNGNNNNNNGNNNANDNANNNDNNNVVEPSPAVEPPAPPPPAPAAKEVTPAVVPEENAGNNNNDNNENNAKEGNNNAEGEAEGYYGYSGEASLAHVSSSKVGATHS